ATPSVGYQSGWTDSSTGEVNMAARWYQPGTGGFTSRDTWQLDPDPSVQANRYTYGNASPLNGTDPDGHRVRMDGGSGSTGTTVPYRPWTPPRETVTADEMRASMQRWSGSPQVSSPNRYNNVKRRHGSVDNDWGSSSSSSSRPGYSGLNCDKYWYKEACGGRGSRADYRTTTRTEIGTAASGSRGGSGGGGGGGGGCGARCRTYVSAAPPPPPIDQNPNNGKSPVPAPKHIVEIATGAIADAAWTLADGWAQVFTAQAVTGMLTSGAQFTPSQSVAILPAPVNVFGGKNGGRDRNDQKCDDGPGVSETGHAVYLPRERYYDDHEGSYQCRATGVYGLLDMSDYNKGRKHPGTNTNGSTRPPGMNEIDAQGHTPANGHLIPAAAKGSGIDLRNLVAEYEETNTPYLNHGVEKEIRNTIKSGKKLSISVIPHYGNAKSGIPTTLEYNYGVPGEWMKHCVIRQSPTGGTTTGSADCPRR
ncbi:RHS repeat-associated core domain-containing protein, partial [Streptomyces sp. NPDC012769]|uniref:RHS repeat-associated core domain-containing protein n=1 Tax=Streptomyces sp. NPDC012769 TaxID=3364848 RepID=UPI0036A31BBC